MKNVKRFAWLLLLTSCMSLLLGVLLITSSMRNHSLSAKNQQLITENEQLQAEVQTLSGKCDIHNCPLCDSDNIELKNDYEWGYRVKCRNCYLSIWYYDTANEAISAWNSLTKEEPIPPIMIAQGD